MAKKTAAKKTAKVETSTPTTDETPNSEVETPTSATGTPAKTIVDGTFPEVETAEVETAEVEVEVEEETPAVGGTPPHVPVAKNINDDTNDSLKDLEEFLATEEYRSLPEGDRQALQHTRNGLKAAIENSAKILAVYTPIKA